MQQRAAGRWRKPWRLWGCRWTETRRSWQPRFWRNLSLAESKTGEPDKAIEAILRAEQLDPQNPDYPFTRATIHMESRRNDLARQALDRCLEIDPQYPPALEMLQAMADR